MKNLIFAVVATSLSICAQAQGPGHQKANMPNHPRVGEVNKRIDNQEHRINKEVKEGKITTEQAQQDRNNLQAINQEKKTMRKMDNGHLTKTDQEALNQQLNTNSKEIGK